MPINNKILDSQFMTVLDPNRRGFGLYVATLQIDFPPNQPNAGDWIRDDVSFLVPDLLFEFNPGIPTYGGSIVMALPATIEVLGARNADLGLVGWGVDSASTALDNHSIRVTARVVGKASASYFDRLRFLVAWKTA